MAKFDKLFNDICGVAVRNERCPFNERLPPGGLGTLARQGKIRVEVFRHNWRIVTILVGEHAGKSTLRDPKLEPDAKPYMVISLESLPRRNDIAPEARRQPWKHGTPRQ